MRKIFSRWLPVALWMVVIFFFSSRPDLPGSRIDWVDFIFKKSAHVTEFAVLTLLAYRAFGRRSPDYAVLFAITYAFSDEIHQFFTPGRGALLTDVAIDSIGIIIASLLITKRKEIWKKFT